MKEFIMFIIIFALALGTVVAISYKPNAPLRNEDIISHQLKTTDLEIYKITYFKGGKVFIRVVPKIHTKDVLLRYLETRKKTVEVLSNAQPDKTIDVTITFKRKYSVDKFKYFLQRYGLKATSYMYKSYPEGVCVFSAEIPEKSIKDLENNLKEKYKKRGYENLKLIDGVVSFRTRIQAKDLMKLQNDSMVLLVDPGPLEVYMENPNAEVFVTVDYIYPSYEKLS